MRTHVTRTAEGFDRRTPEILRMQDAGIIPEDKARNRRAELG